MAILNALANSYSQDERQFILTITMIAVFLFYVGTCALLRWACPWIAGKMEQWLTPNPADPADPADPAG